MPKEIRQMIMEINTEEIKEEKIMANDLISAAINGNIENVRLLLDRGVNINFKDNYGDTALMWASSEDNIYIVEILLNHGANIDLLDDDGDTALDLAVGDGNTDIIELLLEHGAEVNIQNEFGETALIKASRYRRRDMDFVRLDIVRLLLDGGASPYLQNNNGDTALTMASRYGHTDIVDLLNRHIVSSNIQSRFRGRMTREKIRTQKAKQRSSFAKLEDSIRDMTGQDLDPDLYIKLSGLITNMAYNPEVSRRMLEEQDEQDGQDEQDDPYTEWLQDRSQLGSGQRSKRRRRSKRRSKSRKKNML